MGISADRSDRLKEFDDANQLNFLLLSDPRREVAGAFGVRRPGVLPNRRATFVVEPRGGDGTLEVLHVTQSELSMTAHADEALEFLRNRT